ncbi:MAG: hypothetical protein HWN66_08960 [Candidatus Helarchaeota archaeon]|nr:hypothetical protein [Candidatus Helarchaeota archaeon]
MELGLITKNTRIIGGIIVILSGIVSIFLGLIFFPLIYTGYDPFSEGLIWAIYGVVIVFCGSILIYDRTWGGWVALICAPFPIMELPILALSHKEIPLWVVIGPGLAALGVLLGLLTKREFNIIKKQDTFTEEALISVESELSDKYGVKEIEYFGRYFGGLLFLTEFNKDSHGLKIELLYFLHNILNRKVILASKMIPDSSQLKDNLYYLFRLKYGTLKTNIKEISFFK